jgi:hypothetical protein
LLSGRIQEITNLFGTIPDFLVDQWVKAMLEDKKWDEQTLVTLIRDRRESPFVVKQTTETLRRILPQGFPPKWLISRGIRRLFASFVAIREAEFLLTHCRFGTS